MLCATTGAMPEEKPGRRELNGEHHFWSTASECCSLSAPWLLV